jgi:hypothetical protein
MVPVTCFIVQLLDTNEGFNTKEWSPRSDHVIYTRNGNFFLALLFILLEIDNAIVWLRVGKKNVDQTNIHCALSVHNASRLSSTKCITYNHYLAPVYSPLRFRWIYLFNFVIKCTTHTFATGQTSQRQEILSLNSLSLVYLSFTNKHSCYTNVHLQFIVEKSLDILRRRKLKS